MCFCHRSVPGVSYRMRLSLENKGTHYRYGPYPVNSKVDIFSRNRWPLSLALRGRGGYRRGWGLFTYIIPALPCGSGFAVWVLCYSWTLRQQSHHHIYHTSLREESPSNPPMIQTLPSKTVQECKYRPPNRTSATSSLQLAPSSECHASFRR